jgi:phosphotriesterase-related protein
VQAGLVKVAGGFHALDAHARWTPAAAAEAHRATGAPIAVHLELGTGALDVLDVLCGESGVPPHRVVLRHLNRSPDLVTHRQAAESGWPLAFDGPSLAHRATDRRMPDAVPPGRRRVRRSAAAGRGHHHGRRPLGVGEELVRRILTVNPGRAFGAEWRC